MGGGNHSAEALLQGICELIERDAETLWQLGGPDTKRMTRVAPSSVDDPSARTMLDLLLSHPIRI